MREDNEDAARDLVQRACRAEPAQLGMSAAAGLAEVFARYHRETSPTVPDSGALPGDRRVEDGPDVVVLLSARRRAKYERLGGELGRGEPAVTTGKPWRLVPPRTYRPRVKDVHRPTRFGEGRIRIGGQIFGLVSEVRDPDGAAWALLELLDGTRTLDQVAADLIQRFPNRSAEEVQRDIEILADLGYVEDAAEPPPVDLTQREQERYSRGWALSWWMDRTRRPSSWDFQTRLQQSRVVVVGAGGVGCTAALALASSGVGQLHLVDPEAVELSNLNRQVLYTEQDLGRSKVDVAVERLRAVNSEITVTADRVRIENTESLQELAATCDVLVMSAAQPAEILTWTNRACLRTRTAWVWGGYHGPQVGMGVYEPGSGPCFECARAAEQDGETRKSPTTPWNPQSRTHAANAVTAGLTGNLVAHAVLSLLTGTPKLATNRTYSFNVLNLDQNASVLERPHPKCQACGQQQVHTA